MFWMSFFGHLEHLDKAGAPTEGAERSLTGIIGAFFAITVFGMTSALLAASRSERPDALGRS